MTLAARRHAKIVDKAKGLESWPRQDGKWNSGKGRGGSSWQTGDHGEESGKGKNKKGKGGGKRYSWTEKAKESWRYRQQNQWQKEQPEKGKDDKTKDK